MRVGRNARIRRRNEGTRNHEGVSPLVRRFSGPEVNRSVRPSAKVRHVVGRGFARTRGSVVYPITMLGVELDVAERGSVSLSSLAVSAIGLVFRERSLPENSANLRRYKSMV